MSQRSATTRDLGDGDVGLWLPYEDRHRAKRIPGARWDANLKAWRIPRPLAAEARASAAAANGDNELSVKHALTALFYATPKQIWQCTYKALAKEWHPDTGGDLEAMQALTAAWDEVSK